jgi:hypothetical protein
MKTFTINVLLLACSLSANAQFTTVASGLLSPAGGGFYVSTLTGFPFLTGKATIYELSAQGAVSVYATGLTTLTDLILDHHSGDLYAL